MTFPRIRPGQRGGTSQIIEPGGGDVDATISHGTDAQSQSGYSMVGPTLDTGSETMADAFTSVLSLPQGTDTQEMDEGSFSGSAALPTGTETHSANEVSMMGPTFPQGTQSDSVTFGGAAVGTAIPNTVTTVDNAGTPNWTNPDNIKDQDDDEASITVNTGPTAANSSNDQLLVTSWTGIGARPSGWSRSKVEVVIRHRWDLTVGPLSTASIDLSLRDSIGVVIVTLFNRVQGSGDQATLLTETFDVTAAVAALSDAQLANLRVWAIDISNLLIATGGNHSWNIAWIRIDVTYSPPVIS